MHYHRRLGESLAELRRFLVGVATVEQTLDRIAHLGRDAVEPADEAGVTMCVDGEVTTAFFTDPEVSEIDEAQYEAGDGPCLQAFRGGATYRIDSTIGDTRFPAFSEACLQHGILSTLSLPLLVDDSPRGAFNLYSRQHNGFTDEDEAAAGAFATHAAVVMARNPGAYWESDQLTEDATAAVQSLVLIEQAKGMLMGSSLHVTADEAFAMLVQASQRENLKLRDIAQMVVERHSADGRRSEHGSDGAAQGGSVWGWVLGLE